MKVLALLATAGLVPIAAHATDLQTSSIGGMPYYLLPASSGCSPASPCSVVTYLSYMGEDAGSTASDIQRYFGGSFAQRNPHTVVIAPMIQQDESSAVNWGGYDGITSSQQTQMIGVVKGVEQQMGASVNPAASVVTGGSLGGDGTQAALIAYGPKGTVQPGIFSAGLSFDAATYAAAGDATATAALCGVPLMAVHGSADTNQSITYDQGLQQSLASCGSFTLSSIQGAGHGTWSSDAGYRAGVGPGTPLGWLSGQLGSAGNPASAANAVAAVGARQAATMSADATSSAATIDTAPGSSSSTLKDASSLASSVIAPGAGSVADDDGNNWQISPSGSIQENGEWVAGGGDTAELQIVNGTVYGLDSRGHGWSTFNPDAQAWTFASAPPSDAPSLTPAAAETATPQAAVSASSAIEQPSDNCGAQDGAFGVLPLTAGGPGQIVGPDGNVFVPRGVNVLEGQEIPASTLLATMPGINFVRYALYNYPAPAQIADYVKSLTQSGIVVELENHNNDAGNAGGSQGPIFTGQLLSNESNWYSSNASYFSSDPRVWFGTNNEPSETGANGQADAAALSSWQRGTYQAIRSTGNKNPIMLEVNAWKPDMVNVGYNPADYADMSNAFWDAHDYPWFSQYSTDRGQILASLLAMVKGTQSITGAGGLIMPVFIGEYGPSQSDTQAAPNGDQLVDVVQRAVLDGQVAGAAAWAYSSAIPIDNLVDQAGGLTRFGQSVASYLAQPVHGMSVCTVSTASTNSSEPAAPPGSVAVTSRDAPLTTTPPDRVATTPATAAASNADLAASDAQAQLDAIQQQVGALQSGQQALGTGTSTIQAVGSSLPNPTAQQ
jgi:hypothetical protein